MAKVMLVEDDNNLREIYEARMQAEGYDVVSAKDGEEALVVAKAEKPELIISDVMMPKISGFEMLDILRNTDGLKEVKVIMLTALGQADDQQRADRLGADRYLVKSQVTLEDIVSVAHQLLGDGTEPETPVATPVPAPAPTAEPAAPIDVPVAVAPEPVTTPAPAPSEPVAVPAPQPAVTPVAAAPATSFSAVQVDAPAEPVVAESDFVVPAPADDSSATAQSTAQEEAAVEAQIEQFVSSTSEAAPAVTNTPAETTTEVDANQAADDQMMAEALNTLTASVPASEPTVPVVVNPAPASPISAEVTAETPEPAPDLSVNKSAIAGKKIISPITDTAVKPDLNALLAQEEAKEQLTQPAAPAPPAVPVAPAASSPTPVASPTPAPTGDKPDPSSISL